MFKSLIPGYTLSSYFLMLLNKRLIFSSLDLSNLSDTINVHLRLRPTYSLRVKLGADGIGVASSLVYYSCKGLIYFIYERRTKSNLILEM